MRSLDLREKIADKKGIAETYNNLANIHCEEGDYQQAADKLEKSIKIMSEIGFRTGIAGTSMNLGTVYKDLGRHDDSLKMLQKSLRISEEIENMPVVALSLANLGSVNLELQDFSQARKNLEKSLQLMQDLDFKIFEPQARVWLSHALLELGLEFEAKQMAIKAQEIAEDLNQKAIQGFAKRILGVIELNQLKNKTLTSADHELQKRIQHLLRESLHIFEELKMEHEFGRTCLELAKFYLQYGNEDASQNYKNRAKGIFEKLHALGDLEKANKIK